MQARSPLLGDFIVQDLIIHEMLRKKGKATQHNPPKAVIYQRKSCLGWDLNPRPSACQVLLLPTELPPQLSWLGSNHIYNTKHLNQSITNQINRSTQTQYKREGRGNQTSKDTKHQTKCMYIHDLIVYEMLKIILTFPWPVRGVVCFGSCFEGFKQCLASSTITCSFSATL